MDKKEKLILFKDVINILLKPMTSSCLCRHIYAYEIYKYMRETHKIHSISLDMHNEMVKLGFAKEIEENDGPYIETYLANEEELRLVKEAVEQSEIEDRIIDVSKWAEELS